MRAGKYISNFIWRVFETCGTQVVAFLVSVVLARLIDPADFGTLALVSVFISLCTILADSGFGMALVQKKDSDDLDFSSVFYFNVFMCLVLYAAIYFCSPLIAQLYNNPALILIIRIQSIGLVVAGVKSIQTAYVTKHLLFKKFFFSTIGATIVSAAVGIWMAYLGLGIWALVAQSLVSNVIGTIILWLVVPWRPQWRFSFTRIKKLFSYGSKLLLSSLINIGYNDLRQLIIGKVFTTTDLAFFNRGAKLPDIFNNVVSTGANSVLMPAMASAQDYREEVKKIVKKSIMVQSFVLLPVFTGLAVCAKPIICVLPTEKWLPAAQFMQIFCGIYMFECLAGTNINALKAMGFSGKTLAIECIKTPLYTLILLAMMPYGVEAIALGSLVGCLIGVILCVIPGKKAFNYSIFQQTRDILPHIVLSAVMGICVWPISLLGFSDIVELALQVLVGITVYTSLAALFKLESFSYLLGLIRTFIKKQ